ncbi:hypothetical protein A2U01_0103148, partial [Trifolium medium]|nr:hypothetical protein [Trifolium medium]
FGIPGGILVDVPKVDTPVLSYFPLSFVYHFLSSFYVVFEKAEGMV